MIADLNQRHNSTTAADAQEVATGFEHENIEGWVPALASEEEIRTALEKAFDYRGDVTITLKSGSKIEGYIFDRRSTPSIYQSTVRIVPKGTNEKLVVPYTEIAALAFTGRDAAAGKSWETWARQYQEKKQAGEKKIGLDPEPLDEQ
jgi:hypothetical protein